MKITLGILYGSRSCEHDVSIISASQAAYAAGKGEYDVVMIYIDRAGRWFVGDKLREISFYQSFDEKLVSRVLPLGENGKLLLIRYPGEKKSFFGGGRTVLFSVDVVMPVLHGMNGEDGTVQGMLEMMDVPYTSPSVLGSSLGMDKIAMKLFFRGMGLPVLPDVWTDRVRLQKNMEAELDLCEKALPYPMYVKPANLGSSIGISRADDRAGLRKALEVAASYDRRVLVEKGVKNLKEINCSVLGWGGDARPSVLEMPVRWEEFLTFDEKYLRGGKRSEGMTSLSRQIPAPIGDELTRRIQDISVKIFNAMDLKGVVRIDYILDGDDNALYVGEVNTIPGSLAFYLWESAGLSFTQLIDKMVSCAYEAAAAKRESVFSYDSTILDRQKSGGKMRK